MKLLNTQNAKTTKGESLGYLTGILYLAPLDIAVKGKSLCPWASAGCGPSCLFTSGRGKMANVKNARIRKAKWFLSDRRGFMEQLGNDIDALVRKAKKLDMKPAVRLNGTSDIMWPNSFIDNWQIQFYDYTKNPVQALAFAKGRLPRNYHVTFSRSEANDKDCKRVLAAGGTVAAVFQQLPNEWQGYDVVDGDAHDLRFLDKSPSWVGLKAKGDATKDKSGFVIRA